jgi:glutamyl-tRNA synthetase
MYRGRFAPSPTGDLHFGSAACALLAWTWARSQGGAFVLRVEDIDTPRVKAGVEARQLEDLRWLGLDWDEGPDVGGAHAHYRQSERLAGYGEAIEMLARRGLTYYCDCSRADIARAASAPHEGDEGPRYPGSCRDLGMRERTWKRSPAIRLKVPDRDVFVDDRLQGAFTENVLQRVGDFVLRRGDGVYAYQLAVVVDDLAMGVTDVVRGFDLLGSTARQILLADLMGGSPPRYAHHAMVLSADGGRMAKRGGGETLRDARRSGVEGSAVVSALATALGLAPLDATGGAIALAQILSTFDAARLRGCKAVTVSPGLLAGAPRSEPCR